MAQSKRSTREFRRAAAMVLLGTALVAQQPNTPSGSLRFNGADGPPFPITLNVAAPAALTISVDGTAALAPFALFQSPLYPSSIITPAGQRVDLDLASLVVVMNGATPTLPPIWNAFAVLGGGGTFSLTLPISFSVPGPTPLFAFQAIVLDPAGPDGFVLTAASDVTLVSTPDYGTVSYGRGTTTGNHQGFVNAWPGPAIPWGGVSGDFDVETMGLAGFKMWSAAASHPWWRRDLATLPITAMQVRENASFPYQRTLQGDLYCFQDNAASPSTFGFLLVDPAGVPVVLGDTVIAGTGSGATSIPYEALVAVEGNLMLAVRDRAATDPVAPGEPDQALLFSLDGSTFAVTGTAAANLTPPSAGLVEILEESLAITAAGQCFFVGSTLSGASGGPLFSAPTAGVGACSPATAVTVPDVVAVGLPPDSVDGEVRLSEDRTLLVFQAGISATAEDLYVVSGISASGFTVTNLSAFATPTEIEEFGDASDGLDNHVAISPGNTMVAFVTRQAAADEVWVVPADGSSPPVQVTDAARFAATMDEVLELHWADEDNLLFFCGDSSTFTDLFRFQVSTATATNLTGTSGSMAPPFAGAPTIDPDEVFYELGRAWLYFVRDGGVDGSGNPTANLVGVDLATFALADVTGGEFASGTAPHVDGGAASVMSLAYAPTGSQVLFVRELATGNDDDLFHFDAAAGGAAVMLSSHAGSSGITIDSLAIQGASVAWSDNASGQEDIFMATLGAPGSGALLFGNPAPGGGDLADGALVWHPTLPQLYAVFGTNGTSNPTDASLFWIDAAGPASHVVAPGPASFWIFRP